MADLGVRVRDHKREPTLREVVTHRQPGLPPANDQNIDPSVTTELSFARDEFSDSQSASEELATGLSQKLEGVPVLARNPTIQ